MSITFPDPFNNTKEWKALPLMMLNSYMNLPPINRLKNWRFGCQQSTMWMTYGDSYREWQLLIEAQGLCHWETLL